MEGDHGPEDNVLICFDRFNAPVVTPTYEAEEIAVLVVPPTVYVPCTVAVFGLFPNKAGVEAVTQVTVSAYLARVAQVQPDRSRPRPRH